VASGSELLIGALTALVNHVLASEDWASSRLAKFAGQSVRISFGTLSFAVAISAKGLLEARPAAPDSPATVSITLPDDTPLRLLTNPTSLLSSANISGAADLAETLGFVIRHLRWDAESDLSLLLGDILGRRAAQLFRALGRWQASAAHNGLMALAEWLSEESGLLAARRDVETYGLTVATLDDDCHRLEGRLQRIESARNPQ